MNKRERELRKFQEKMAALEQQLGIAPPAETPAPALASFLGSNARPEAGAGAGTGFRSGRTSRSGGGSSSASGASRSSGGGVGQASSGGSARVSSGGGTGSASSISLSRGISMPGCKGAPSTPGGNN